MRWVRWGAVVALAIVVSLALVVVWNTRSRGERLVADVTRLSAFRARPVHREPVLPVRTFQECVAPLLDAQPDAGTFELTRSAAFSEQVALVTDGGAPYASLPDDVKADANRLEPWVEAVVACTRAPGHGDAEGLGLFAGWTHPRQMGPLNLMSTVPRLVRLELRAALARGDVRAAREHCSDSLALARDLVHDRGLVGGMGFASITALITPGCVSALEASDAEGRSDFLRELRAIRGSTPTFRDILESERAQMQVVLFGALLSEGQLARLSSNARSLADTPLGSSSASKLTLALMWKSYLTRLDRMIEACGSSTRDAELAAVEQEVSLLDWLDGDGPRGSFVAFAQRYDAGLRAMAELETAARRLEPAP